MHQSTVMAYQFNGFRATKPVVRLIDSDNGFYEVFFCAYDSDGKKHYCRYKKDINKEPKSKRKVQASATAEVLWEALLGGWNPLVNKYPDFRKQVRQDHVLFCDALDIAKEIKRKILSKYSMYDYDGCIRFLKAAARKTGHYYQRIREFKRSDIRDIMETARETNRWSNKARNKYLTIFKSLLSVLVDEELIDFNPAAKIRNDPEEQTEGFRRLTDDEKETIADHLLLHAPDFFEYLMFIYDDGIRRKEALMLKISDFNMTRKEITIRPEVAKTRKARTVPITDTILQILLRRQIWNFPQEYYLFSSDKFLPGPNPYHPNTPTSLWRRLVIEGLGIDCKLYSLKHKGADDKIEAGIDLDVLRTLYGHKSKQMTEIYARAVKDKYKQQIIDKAPVFAKVVQMKKRAQ